MYPIPDHLKSCLIPVGDENSELQVSGLIRCKCGHTLFIPYTNGAGTIAAARCHACGNKLMLFHAGRHGWDAFVAKADYLYDLPAKLHALSKCPACQEQTALGLRVYITSYGREDFIRDSELSDENGNPLREEDWVNAFSSFRMDVVCPLCAHTTESIIDIETA